MIFRIGEKQRLAAAYALVSTGSVLAFILAGEGRFGPLLSGYKVLILRELLLPSGFVLANLFVSHGISSR
jgi:hypothetical protein